MKLIFTKLETTATEIKVAFDGVNYKPYNVDEIKSNGYIQFTEEECPDLTKVKIQGKFSTFGSVEVNKAVELERGEGGKIVIDGKFSNGSAGAYYDGYNTLLRLSLRLPYDEDGVGYLLKKGDYYGFEYGYDAFTLDRSSYKQFSLSDLTEGEELECFMIESIGGGNPYKATPTGIFVKVHISE